MGGVAQMSSFWGRIWGQIDTGGMIWGDKMTNNVR